MEINVTLIVQILVFIAFVWFSMRFVWPPLVKALEARQDKIAEGLAAAERGQRDLELARHRVIEELKIAKQQAADIIDKAHHRANHMIDEAKETAKAEAQRMLMLAEQTLLQEINRAKDDLRRQVGQLAVLGAERILQREIDEKANQAVLDRLIEEI